MFAFSDRAYRYCIIGNATEIAMHKLSVLDDNQKLHPILSVVVPLYNEASVLPELHQRLCQVLGALADSSEIIYIDDGSKDASRQLIQHFPASGSEQVYIGLSRNFGKEAAMSAGLEHSRGQAVILIDADLQDPPDLIPGMVAAWRQGFDLVNMRRRKRLGETWFKRFSAAIFYRLMNWMSPMSVPENVGDFRLLSRQVVDHLNALPERNRYMKGLFAWPGFSQTTIEFDRDPRFGGVSKWSYSKLIGLAVDGISAFSIRPLRLATWTGLLVAMSAFGYGGWVIAKTLIFGESVAGYPSIMVVQLALGGVQLLALGVIGEYLGRVFIEVKNRPNYLVQEIQNQPAIDSDEEVLDDEDALEVEV